LHYVIQKDGARDLVLPPWGPTARWSLEEVSPLHSDPIIDVDCTHSIPLVYYLEEICHQDQEF